MRRPPLGLAALLLAAAIVLAMLLPGTATAAAVTNLRLTQLSPDTPNVDVTITSSTGRKYQVDDFGYGNVTTYQTIDSGTYTVQTRLTSNPTAPPTVIGTLQADQSRVYTAAVLGPRAGASVALLTDDLTLPGPRSARMRVVQAAQGAGSVAVTWNGAVMGASVVFGNATDYVSATAGHGIVGVTPTSGAPFTLPVDLADGGVYTVIVLQRGPSLGGHVLLDALDNRGGGGGNSGGGNSGGGNSGGGNSGGGNSGGGNSSGGNSSGNGGGGQYPNGQPPPPTPKNLFSRIGGATDWESTRAGLYGECEDPTSDSRKEGFTEGQCKTAADYFLENAEVGDDPNPPPPGSHCDTRWSNGKVLVASDGTTDCKKGFGEDNRPKPSVAPKPPGTSTRQFQLRVSDPSGASSTAQPPTGAPTGTEPPVLPASSTPTPPNTEPPPNPAPQPAPAPNTEPPPNTGPPPNPAPQPAPAPAPKPQPAPAPKPQPAPGPSGGNSSGESGGGNTGSGQSGSGDSSGGSSSGSGNSSGGSNSGSGDSSGGSSSGSGNN